MPKTALAQDEPSYEEWLATPHEGDYRRGQALMNALPNRLYNFISLTVFDVFNVPSPGERRWNEINHQARLAAMKKMDRFLLWTKLCWDIIDKNEMDEAFKLVREEIPD